MIEQLKEIEQIHRDEIDTLVLAKTQAEKAFADAQTQLQDAQVQANKAIQEVSNTLNSEVIEQMKAKILKDRQKYENKEKKLKGAIEALAAEKQKLEQINLMHADNQDTKSQEQEKRLVEYQK